MDLCVQVENYDWTREMPHKSDMDDSLTQMQVFDLANQTTCIDDM